jgi:WD repeat and SOF domain-containing protein 1
MGRERMFAKPFLGQLGNGHVQGVYSMCKVGALGG